MSRNIKLTENDIQTAIVDIRELLQQLTLNTESKVNIDFQKYLCKKNRKAKVVFSENAWLKMQWLITKFNSEVAWHGVAKRDEDPESDTYYITDILLYPQKVTGTTVNTDQFLYEKWLMELDDDTFNNLRMHGHSHVNMSPSPSSVDIAHRSELLDKLTDDMFYIFLIMNKKNVYTAAIYDYRKNIYFDTDDVDIEVESEGSVNAADFTNDAEKLVRSNATTYGNYGRGYGSSYGGYSGGYGNSYYSNFGSGGASSGAAKSDNAKKSNTDTPKVSDAKTTPTTTKTESKKDKKKKGKRKKNWASSQGSFWEDKDIYGYDDYDE